MKKDVFWNQLTYKQMIGLITYTILLVLALLHFDIVLSVIKLLFSLLKPFLIGFAIAYIFRIPMRFFEEKLPAKIKKGRSAFAALCALLCIVALFTFVISVAVPQLSNSISTLIEEFPAYAKASEETILKYMRMYHLDQTLLEQWHLYSAQVEEAVLNIAKSIVPTLMAMTGSIISTVTDLIMSLVSAIYFVVTKDTLLKHARKVFYAFLNEKQFKYGQKVVALSDKTFSNFISGQLVEAFIIGTLCYIGALVLRLQYAPILAVVVGCTNIIPIFGPIIGTVVCAGLLLFVNPMQALVFVVFGILLQQFESNLIYPKVVGSSVGLSGVWVLLAVSVGGGLFGALGMILGLPVFAIIYRLFADEVNCRVKIKEKKGIV